MIKQLALEKLQDEYDLAVAGRLKADFLTALLQYVLTANY